MKLSRIAALGGAVIIVVGLGSGRASAQTEDPCRPSSRTDDAVSLTVNGTTLDPMHIAQAWVEADETGAVTSFYFVGSACTDGEREIDVFATLTPSGEVSHTRAAFRSSNPRSRSTWHTLRPGGRATLRIATATPRVVAGTFSFVAPPGPHADNQDTMTITGSFVIRSVYVVPPASTP